MVFLTMNDSCLNPYLLCRILSSSGSFSSLLQDFIIKLFVEEDSWIIKCKTIHGLAVIKPTELHTLEITIPLTTLDPEKDYHAASITSLSEVLNGTLNIISSSKLLLLYSVYLPIHDINNSSSIDKAGKTIKTEIKYVKDRLALLKTAKEEDVDDLDVFDAESFNSQLQELKESNNSDDELDDDDFLDDEDN